MKRRAILSATILTCLLLLLLLIGLTTRTASHAPRLVPVAQEISKSLHENDLPDDPAEVGGFCSWNGTNYDLDFALQKERNWGQSFLLKADHATRSLKLLDRDFKFQWRGYFDATGTHHLYEGEKAGPGKGGDGGVYLRDIIDQSVRSLVQPDNSGQYALARFCDDGVVYSRNRLLWRVSLDGSNNRPLFPTNASYR